MTAEDEVWILRHGEAVRMGTAALVRVALGGGRGRILQRP